MELAIDPPAETSDPVEGAGDMAATPAEEIEDTSSREKAAPSAHQALWNELKGVPSLGIQHHEIEWLAYMDEASGVPFFVHAKSGYTTWVEPEDGDFVWGEEGDAMDISEKEKENLGPDFLDTPWVCPTYARAIEHRKNKLFERGEANICSMNSKRLGKLGVGVKLYFELVQFFAVMLLMFGLLSIPALQAYTSGTGIAPANLDPWMLAAATPGMYAPSASTPATPDDIITVGGVESRRGDTTRIISYIDATISVVLFAFFFFFRFYVHYVDHATHKTVSSTSDYAIQIEDGLPEDATEAEIIDHFSDLYRLDTVDVRGRLPYEAGDVHHCAVEREGLVYPVMDLDHVDGDETYMNKWVAEVTLIRNDGNALLKYLGMRHTQREIEKTRASVKKYSDDTPFSKGPNETKRRKYEEHLMMLEYEEDNDLKMVKEDNRVIGAFVVFDHEESYLRAIEDYRMQDNQTSFRLCSCCHKSTKHLLFRNKHRLKVRQAPEASDIQFEFLSSVGHTQKRRCISRGIIGLMIMASFVVVYGLMSAKRALDAHVPSTDVCTSPGLRQALFGGNHTPAKFAGKRDKRLDGACKAAIADDEGGYYLTVNDLAPFYGNISSTCSESAHSCIKQEGTGHLCPCVSALSTAPCSNVFAGTQFPAKTIASCYCLFEFSAALDAEDFVAGTTDFLNSEGDLCGVVVRETLQSKAILLMSSACVSIINIFITNSIVYLVSKERHSRKSAESSEIVLLSLLGQFLNTTFVIMLIYMRIPGISAVDVPFLFNGEYDRLTVGWYAVVAVFIQTTMVISAVSTHAKTILTHCVLMRMRRRKAKRNEENYLMQAEMDEEVIGDEFCMEDRASQQLLLFAVPVVFSAGMPALFFIGAGGLLLGDFVDKYELARLSPHPPPQDASTPNVMVSMLPILILCRLAFATFVYSNDDIFGGGTSEYYTTYVAPFDRLKLFQGLSSSASFPHFVLFAIVLAYIVLRTVLWPIISGSFHMIEEGLESMSCFHGGRNSLRRLGKVGKSAFTEYYCERFDKDFRSSFLKTDHQLGAKRKKKNGIISLVADLVRPLSKLEKNLGWRVVNSASFPEHTDDRMAPEAHYKVKAWMSKGIVKGIQHNRGQLKRTWEVIGENGPSSYRLEKHPKYQVIKLLREERASNEELDVQHRKKKKALGKQASSKKYVVQHIDSGSGSSSSSGSEDDED